MSHHGFDETGAPAHRLAYTYAIGEIGPGLVVRHRCDNAPCVRPDHLETGTQQQNVQDMVERGRAHWQRQKLGWPDRFFWAVATRWARAQGIDPYTLWRATTGDPLPIGIVERFRQQMGVELATVVHPRTLVAAGGGL